MPMIRELAVEAENLKVKSKLLFEIRINFLSYIEENSAK